MEDAAVGAQCYVFIAEPAYYSTLVCPSSETPLGPDMTVAPSSSPTLDRLPRRFWLDSPLIPSPLAAKRPVHPKTPQPAENTPQKDPINFAGYFSRPATLFLAGC
jgi:hypothetical protein